MPKIGISILKTSALATILGLLLQFAANAQLSSDRFQPTDNGGPTTSQDAGTRQNVDDRCFEEGARRLGAGACK